MNALPQASLCRFFTCLACHCSAFMSASPCHDVPSVERGSVAVPSRRLRTSPRRCEAPRGLKLCRFNTGPPGHHHPLVWLFIALHDTAGAANSRPDCLRTTAATPPHRRSRCAAAVASPAAAVTRRTVPPLCAVAAAVLCCDGGPRGAECPSRANHGNGSRRTPVAPGVTSASRHVITSEGAQRPKLVLT